MSDTPARNIVKIHGRDYMTVAGRVQLAHDAMKNISIKTEVLPIQDQVVVRATVETPKGTFTGISAANPSKYIEKQSPYEVAETSAVGRALGFAGFGSLDNIATADEIVKSNSSSQTSTFIPKTDKYNTKAQYNKQQTIEGSTSQNKYGR